MLSYKEYKELNESLGTTTLGLSSGVRPIVPLQSIIPDAETLAEAKKKLKKKMLDEVPPEEEDLEDNEKIKIKPEKGKIIDDVDDVDDEEDEDDVDDEEDEEDVDVDDDEEVLNTDKKRNKEGEKEVPSEVMFSKKSKSKMKKKSSKKMKNENELTDIEYWKTYYDLIK
jgi:hypothetical protein